MDEKTRRTGGDPSSAARRIEPGRELPKDEQKNWIKSYEGKSATVEVSGLQEEWMVVGPAYRQETGGTVIKVIVNKRVEGKVSSFEISVPELEAKGLDWK